jgi:hypothetical protein
VRLEENDWKRSLNTILRKRRADIERVLRDYDVPLLEEECVFRRSRPGIPI